MANGRNNRNKKKRPPRKSFGQRLEEGVEAAGDLGRTAVNRPRELPRHAEGILRRWFREVWSVRGGGLYATGFAVTFLYLEVVEIVWDDIPSLFTTNLASGAVIGLIIDFFIDTFVNFVTALMWPAFVAMFAPPWGAIGLGIAFLVFDRFLRKHVEAWLDRDDEPVREPAPSQSPQSPSQSES